MPPRPGNAEGGDDDLGLGLIRPGTAWGVEEEQANDGAAPPSFLIETYGCQMNVADSNVVRGILKGAGYVEASSLDDASVVLANTCAIRENAENRAWQRVQYYGHIRKQRKRKRERPLTVGLLGCMAERLKEKVLEGGAVDVVAGPDAYRDLPRLLSIAQGGDPAINVQLSHEETYADIKPVRRAEWGAFDKTAFITAMRGCANMCSFCIVPFVRGVERSRPLESIVEEAKRLAGEGVKEIWCLGQNVNSYVDQSPAAIQAYPQGDYVSTSGFSNNYRRQGGAGAYFADLLHRVADVDPELRVRFTSPHPKDFPDALMSAIASRHNICSQVHMPAQSGSSVVLERMRRGYTREAYLALVQRMREAIPGVALSSDFIAGFCGETLHDHRETLSLMTEVEYDMAFMFAYSMRARTRAAYRLEDDVPAEEKQRRLAEIIDTFQACVTRRNALERGREHIVLVEGKARKWDPDAPTLTGRTDTNKRVVFSDGSVPCLASGVPVKLAPGDYALVRITDSTQHTLLGEPLGRSSLVELTKRLAS
jgi:MiaB/RimO family radical SAM methylthiotransferase